MSRGFQRALAVALLAAVLALVWRGALQPLWQAYQQDRVLVEEHRDAIARFRGIAASREAFEAAAREAASSATDEGALIEAESATLAAAVLQQRVKEVVEGLGGSVVSTQVMDPEPTGPFTQIRVNSRMTVTVSQLQQLLHRFESDRPYVVVEEMLVLSRAGRGSRRRQPIKDELDVRVRLAGFMPGGTAQRRRN